MVSEHALIRALSRFSRSSVSKADERESLHRARTRALIDLLNELRTPLMMIKSPLQTDRHEGELSTVELLDYANRVQAGLEKAIEVLEMDLDADSRDALTDFANIVDRYVASIRPLADRCGAAVEYSSDMSRAVVRMTLPKVQHLLETVTGSLVAAAAGGGRVSITLSQETVEEGPRVLFEARCLEADGGRSPKPTASSEAVDEDPWLDLARGYVQSCGGELRVSANRRIISLPAEDLAADPGETSAVRSSETPRREGATSENSDTETTVLIVDDHAGTRTYLRYALRKYHRILEAADGGAGLELVREHRPDLVISDIMMPVMDGHDLCRAIKEDDDLTHIPVFLVTANAMPSVRARSLESGADDYLVKPFDVDEAVMRVNNEIKSRRQLRRRFSRQIVIKPSEIDVTSEDDALIKRAAEIVELNMENGDFNVQELAAEIGLSSRQLQRKLREIADQSPVEFIRNLRLQRAAQLLEARYGNVSEVAYRVGFTSLSYFAKCFKEEFGESPSVYKEKENSSS